MFRTLWLYIYHLKWRISNVTSHKTQVTLQYVLSPLVRVSHWRATAAGPADARVRCERVCVCGCVHCRQSTLPSLSCHSCGWSRLPSGNWLLPLPAPMVEGRDGSLGCHITLWCHVAFYLPEFVTTSSRLLGLIEQSLHITTTLKSLKYENKYKFM